ncbi:MAG: hypothetical protein OEZ40_01570 [Candidatus Bathyarchaeota archaeon]|nr:hypothetical protein [Candidatus Bathyarchaeota archaeon]
MKEEGELQKTIKAFDRELIKREFWAEGMLNIVERAKKDFQPHFNFHEYIVSLNPIPKTHQEVHEAYQKYVAEVIVKLKKWFGGVQDKAHAKGLKSGEK